MAINKHTVEPEEGQHPLRKRWLSIALAPLLAYGILLIYGLLMENRLLFPPTEHRSDATNAIGGIDLLEGQDGDPLAIVHLEADSGATTVIYLPGSGTGLGGSVWFIRSLHSRGWNVASLDYPGTGASKGRTGEAATHAAVDQLYRYLTKEQKIPAERIVVFGRALGASAALRLAKERPVAGVIAEGAFLSAFEVLGPMRWLPWTRFDNRISAESIEVPVLFIHGTADRRVPFSHAQELRRMAGGNGAYFWVEGAGHNDLLEFAGQSYWTVLRQFIGDLVGHDGGAPTDRGTGGNDAEWVNPEP